MHQLEQDQQEQEQDEVMWAATPKTALARPGVAGVCASG